MITREDTYKKAFEIKKDSLKKKLQHRDMLLSAAYSTEPKLKEIDAELSRVGSLLAITALSGNQDKLAELKEISYTLSAQKTALLKKAEVPEIKYDCPDCKDTGYISGKICDCIKNSANKILAEELSKQMPLDKCDFNSFDLKYYQDKTDKNGENPKRRMTAIFKLCKEYAIKFSPLSSPNLLFFGSSGLGKTHLTLSIVKEVIEKGYLPIYASAENLFSAIENEKFGGENKGNYEACLNCDLLVIDDLGTEMATSFTKSVLYNLINTRLLTNKPTIINTNLTMKEIEQRYTARVTSRLIGSYEAKKFLGEDIRQQKVFERK